MDNTDLLHEITEIDRIVADDIVPYGDVHPVYIINPDLEAKDFPVVPILCSSDQWFFLWWIYRLRHEPRHMHIYSFDNFLIDFIGDIYEDHYIKHRNQN